MLIRINCHQSAVFFSVVAVIALKAESGGAEEEKEEEGAEWEVGFCRGGSAVGRSVGRSVGSSFYRRC